MAYPASLKLITVIGKFDRRAGEPSGTVTFETPSKVWLRSESDDTIVPPFKEICTLDSSGEFTIDLPATDDPEWTPSGWAYSVTIKVDGKTLQGSIELAYDGDDPVYLADVLSSVAPSSGATYILRSLMGAANGVATLDGAGTLSSAQIPSSLVTDSDHAADLALKAPLASPTFTGTVSGVTKSHVGLGNVDNTSDLSKPISTLTQTALDLRVLKARVPFHVKDYGAVGDGVTNDTAAIQAAVDAMTTSSAALLRGGRLVFGKGRFVLTDTILVERVACSIEGDGWSDFNSGYATSAQGTVFIWEGNNTKPMFQVQASRGVRFESIAFVGNTDPSQYPTAAVRMYLTGTDGFKNGMARFDRCSFGRLAGVAGYSGIVMQNGILWEGAVNAQNDTSWITNCRFQGCETGYKTTETQNVLHHIQDSYFWDNEIGIDTSSQMSLTNTYFTGNTTRDLELRSSARMNIREFASELSGQFAKLGSGCQLMVNGGYWQISSAVQADRVIIDAVNDSRNVIRLKDFQLTLFTGYAGGTPIIAATGSTNTAEANKFVELDNVRWVAGAGLGIDETFLSVTPAGALNTITVVGNVQPAAPASQNAGRQRFFFNQVTPFNSTVDFQRDDRLQNTTLRKTAGEYTNDRKLLSLSAGDMVSGTLYLTYFTAQRSETISTLAPYVSQVAAATPTLIRYGVYSVASNGDLTLVASTTNDTTLLTAAFAEAPKALSASWSKLKGHRYAVGALVVSVATMPRLYTVHPYVGAGILDTLLAEEPRETGSVSGQTDLPASVSAGSVTVANRRAPFFKMT